MEHNLFVYIWRHTRLQQLWIIAVILASFPFYFYALDLPKTIVNGPIAGKGFATASATQKFFEIKASLPFLFDGAPMTLFPGFELERLPYLVALSMLFLALVCVNGLFKFYINTYKGRLGERMLRRLRYELVDRVLRFPLPLFKKLRAAEIATMVKDEVEPLGGFIGDAFVQPVFLSGQALTAMVFILLQNWLLGVVSAGIVLIQAFLIPRLRRRLLVLGRRQQLTARELAGRVGEIVDGIAEVRTNDATNLERADISHRLGQIFLIRYELYQRKFFVKFLNNFLAQLTPFFFYLVGGYFAIKGQLDVGQLIAVIAAYKDLPPPIKELIDWDQQRQDVQIKYNQVSEQFSPDMMLAPELQTPEPGPVKPIGGPIEARGLMVEDDTGARLLEHADLVIAPGERVAAVGELNAGAEALSEAIARLLPAKSGRIRIGSDTIDALPESVTGRRLAYVGPDTYLRNTTLRQTLLYGLMHHPAAAEPGLEEKLSAAERLQLEHARFETQSAGNCELDATADWIDYAAVGADGPEALRRDLSDVLKVVDLYDDVYELGLRSPPPPDAGPLIAESILKARAKFREQMASGKLRRLVEVFDENSYCHQATIGENLLFGASLSPGNVIGANLITNPVARRILKATGVEDDLTQIGRRFAETLVELFSGMKGENRVLDRLGTISVEDLPAYEQLIARLTDRAGRDIGEDDRAQLLKLAFTYIEPRQRLALLTDAERERILAARRELRVKLPKDLLSQIAFYTADEVNMGSSLEDNVLFGRVAYGIADGPRRVRDAIRAVLTELHLEDIVVQSGLEFNVGAGGKRLTLAQRQKIGLARALLKRPDLILVNRGLSSLGVGGQRQIIARVLERLDRAQEHKTALLWVVTAPELSQGFDRIAKFRDGRLIDTTGAGAAAGEAAKAPARAPTPA